MSEQLGRTIPDEDPQAETKQRYEQEIEQRLLRILREYGQKIVNWLRQNRRVRRQTESIGGDLTRSSLWGELAGGLKQLLLPMFEEMMQEAAMQAIAQLPFSIGVDFDAINIEAAEWARDYVVELVDDVESKLGKRVSQHLANWIEAGEDLPALEKRIMDLFDAPWRARRVAITEVTRAFAEANLKAWEASRVVNKSEWRTAVDKDVCTICEQNHSKVRALGKQFPTGHTNPPAHPNCRCWLVPVVTR